MGAVIVTEERDKWVDAIAKMIELTQNKRLVWTVGSPSQGVSGQAITPPYYTTYRGRHLRLQRIKVPDPASRDMLGRRDRERERAQTVMEFVDDYDNSLWRFPDVTPLRDLLATVQYQVANVSDFLDDILSEE